MKPFRFQTGFHSGTITQLVDRHASKTFFFQIFFYTTGRWPRQSASGVPIDRGSKLEERRRTFPALFPKALCLPILQCRMESTEWNTVATISVLIGLMSRVQSEKSPLAWNRDALLDGGCRYRQPDVVRCLDSMIGARDELRFTFMGDSRVRQMFFSFLEVP